jgi:multidrug efflux pump subunit AcrA (membrane-fusion protein)
MKETDELEPQQYRRLYWESDVPVRDLRVRLMRKLLYAAVAVFLLMCVTAYYVKFPDQIELPFVLKNDVREEVYKFPFPVYLVEQYVQTGNTVKPGDRLLRLTSPEIVAMLNDYNEAIKDSANLSGARHTSTLRQLDMVRANLRQNLASIEANSRQLELSKQTWAAHEQELQFKLKDATEKSEAYKSLYESKTVARFDMTEKENQQKQAENALQQEKLRYDRENLRLQSAINQLQIENQIAQSQLAKLEADFQGDSAESLSKLELARRRIANTFGMCDITEGAIVVKSPIEGKVSFLFEGEKEINSGATVLKINSANEATYAFLKCPPAIVGKLQAQQVCHLKVLSFPFYEYGSVPGHIRQISLTPDENGQYNVYVALGDPGRLKGLLQPGMDGTAVVIIEEKTLLQYFFRNLKKGYHRVAGGDIL